MHTFQSLFPFVEFESYFIHVSTYIVGYLNRDFCQLPWKLQINSKLEIKN